MDANEYKDYLLGFVFYKYLSDSFLYRSYDFIYNDTPVTMEEALHAYEEACNGEDGQDILEELKETLHYVLAPELTFTSILQSVREKKFSRSPENLQLSDPD